MSDPLSSLTSIASSFEKLLSQGLSTVESSLSSVLNRVDTKLGQSNVITEDINAFKAMVVAGKNLQSDLALTIASLQTLIQTGIHDVETIVATTKGAVTTNVTQITDAVESIVSSVESITQNLPAVIRSTATELEASITKLFDELRVDARTIVTAVENSPLPGQLISIVNTALVSASKLQAKITNDINELGADLERLFANGVAQLEAKLHSAVDEIEAVKTSAENALQTLVTDTNQMLVALDDAAAALEARANLVIAKLGNTASSTVELFLQPVIMIVASIFILVCFKFLIR